MNIRLQLLSSLSFALLATAIAAGDQAAGQDPFSDDAGPFQRINMFDSEEPAAGSSPSSSSAQSRRSVAELRQARALYRANQRVARLEHNLWIGHEPLRPRWNALPMMSTRYRNRTIYVPVYVRTR